METQIGDEMTLTVGGKIDTVYNTFHLHRNSDLETGDLLRKDRHSKA